ncbi:phosphomethylpyrimidine kinase [Mycoavidus cysteinexigens]|uniref:hydroxymethylpyrimidine kinase n=1 Tax=Mycoavidus cysteinexigens TaxID=1553431 RepID=A0A2Z6EUH5_9BURK|nr:bifunctional hydroxymethylpyrimidine kinase/phosphomethylpyrimidine kinase [Mycoavidus cysteinexigens]BBE09109.1 phosphomethylpyrimidine kinase [Mycoavidus cysteinexigens]GAM52150.1 hydroxymethylpyrimidine phosphate kinase ThiD [bacterium endosymbiont of Mortierella elongata FMR23-6]GLR00226.1 hydroxymethylpyrimidine/phosphomethylpyrimidine kinase [Mycoavidus cysteinexigens]
MSTSIHNVLTIAGSDSGGGAGIQADLKTFSALGVYGTTVITALTAQNTHGVHGVYAATAESVSAQLDAVLSDIPIDAVKIGMLATADIVRAVAAALQRYQPAHVILDTVLLSKSQHALLDKEAIAILRAELIPLAELITPNLPEAAALLEQDCATSEEEMVLQGEALCALGARAVLMKGGHLGSEFSPDWLIEANGNARLGGARILSTHTHGTGCTLSSAIAALRPQRLDLENAVSDAKAYLTQALINSAKLTVGSGTGPVHHFYQWW